MLVLGIKPYISMDRNHVKPERLHLGAAYYPEHWPESRWIEDIRLMQAAGLTVVRMAEFAWSTMQPSPDELRLEWLERAIDLLAEHGIQTVLGTPTAAPPPWLVTKYPDILAIDETGRQVQIGNRCHYCVNAIPYHAAAHDIVEAMAKRFGNHPAVIGWQIDNEYNRVCYCDNCRNRFHAFLQDRYGTLENLNQRWSTAYWSQTYSDWSQIPLPVGEHNPGLLLEFKHFVSDSYRRFQNIQLAALRPYLRQGVWVTHNFMGWFGGFDHYQLSANLDLASWDWYVGRGHHDAARSGATHDLTRGFKQQNFWVMETQPGNVNWREVNTVLDKGEARLMAWQAVAHGADALLYWQWRMALGGQEQYHGSLVDSAGLPRPFYTEVQQLGEEFAKVSDLLRGSAPQAEVAIINDYDSRWSIERQPHHHKFDYVNHLLHYYRALDCLGINIDILSANATLTGYKIIICPSLLIITEQQANNLIQFVKNGGTLLLTLRTGMKDEYNALLPLRAPGRLRQAAGIEVEEYYALDDPVPVQSDVFAGQSHIWADRLRVLDPANTEVLARYGKSNGWLDDHPAITRHSFHQGVVYYVGAYPDEVAQQILVDHITREAGVGQFLTPIGVEFRTLTDPQAREIYFLLNHTTESHNIHLPFNTFEHLGGHELSGDVELPPYSVAIITKR